MTLLRSSGSRRVDISVEPTRSQNMTVSCRRSASVDRAAETEARVGLDTSGASAARVDAVSDLRAAIAASSLRRCPTEVTPMLTFAIDIVVVETGRVLFEPQAAQPRRNVHPINPPSARSGTALTTIDLRL